MALLGQTAEDLLQILNGDNPQEQVGAYLVAQIQERLGAVAAAYLRADQDEERFILEASVGLSGVADCSDLSWDTVPFRELLGLSQSSVRFVDLADGALVGLPSRGGAQDLVASWLRSLNDAYAVLMVIPVATGEDIRGVFVVMYTDRPADGEQMLGQATQFATQAALVIENAQLRRQAEQAAVLQERSRLARDLHDSVTQSLYSLTLLAEATRRLADSGDLSQVRRVAARLGEIGQQALKEMRLLVYQLRPSVLRRVGLVRALSQRLETVERRAGVEASLVVEGDWLLPAAIEEQLYYLAQEALNNALKHAAATTIQVRIAVDARLPIRLEIADDGKGFGPDDVAADGGFGLSSMRERAEKLGGRLVIDSMPEKGTSVVVTIDPATIAPGGWSDRG